MLQLRDRKCRMGREAEILRCRDHDTLATWLAGDALRHLDEVSGYLAICGDGRRDWEIWSLPDLTKECWQASDERVEMLRDLEGHEPRRLSGVGGPTRQWAVPMRDGVDQLRGALLMAEDEPGGSADFRDWLQDAGAFVLLILERIERELRLDILEAEVAELESLKADFMDTVSHELKTPLTSIIGFSDLAANLPGTESIAALPGFLQSIQDNAGKLNKLIGEVLMMSDMASVEGMLEIGEHPLTQLMQRFHGEMLPGLDESSRVRCPELGGDRILRVDPHQFLRILEHLIKNALSFSPDSQPVRVEFTLLSGRRRGDQTDFLRIDVIDMGPGIPAVEQERIFRKFYQVDGSSTRIRGGVGLGLALAKEFTAAMGGRLWVESEPGAGATFSFTVPVIRDDEKTTD